MGSPMRAQQPSLIGSPLPLMPAGHAAAAGKWQQMPVLLGMLA